MFGWYSLERNCRKLSQQPLGGDFTSFFIMSSASLQQSQRVLFFFPPILFSYTARTSQVLVKSSEACVDACGQEEKLTFD